MTPEAPGGLVVLDLQDRNRPHAALMTTVLPRQNATEFLMVSWNTVGCEDPEESLGGGVVCVEIAKNFVRRGPRAVELDEIGEKGLGFRFPNRWGDGLMMVAVLPPGHVVQSEVDVEPAPRASKEFDKRQALFWDFTGNPETAAIFLRLTGLEPPGSARDAARRMNEWLREARADRHEDGSPWSGVSIRA